ncbi:YtfJ family protein [Acerihabitans sp. KWT182]|uniref:YtfJ family protein n=1 Tax=Acerihabitans sp. KWT182 TaxID=3157919 RepID=A0AAU7QB80_9GAMM
MPSRLLLLIVVLFTPFGLQAHNLHIGATPPKVGVADKGELLYQNNEFSYKSWNSAQLKGKIHLLQHMAARTSAGEMNAAMIEAVKKANLPQKYYQTTTVVNADDALFSSGAYFRNWLENNKKMTPAAQFVLDTHGDMRQIWGLKAKSSAIVVLDARERVRYVKEGALTLQDVQQVIDLLHRLLPRGAM